jgi:branched-chain amino acid transport system substrate-binding protein
MLPDDRKDKAGRMRMGRPLRGYHGIALAVLLLFAARPAPAADEAFDFDVVLPLTGGGAFLGTTQQAIIRETEKAINREGGVHGRPARFTFHDDQSSPQIAVQLTSEIVAKNPPVVFGSTLSSICNAMSPLMRTGPVHYCFSPSIRPVAGGYVFTDQIASRDQQVVLLRYFHAKGWNRIALISTTDASGQDADRAINDAVKLPEFAAMQIVEDNRFNVTDVSIAAQIARIEAAKPDVVISWATAAAGATVFRGLAQAGLSLPVAASGSNMTYGQMIEYAAFLPKQLFFGVSGWAASGDPEVALPPQVLAEQKLFLASVAAAGIHPDASSDIGWDTERIVVKALNALPPGASAAELHDYLEQMKGYSGIDGIYDFTKVPQRGIDVSNALVVEWNAEKKNWIPVTKLSVAREDVRLS